MRTDHPQGVERKFATDHVICPKCSAPMLIASVEINRVSERVTYRCEPCNEVAVKESRIDLPE